MPQLPSGHHIGIQANSLSRLLQEVGRGVRVHELMAIESEQHLWKYIDIVYFRPADSARGSVVLIEGSATPPADLEPYESGFTLATIEEELRRWPAEDQQAFREFIASGPARRILADLLDQVIRVRTGILDRGGFFARVQALWWQQGVHPLQTDEADSGAGDTAWAATFDDPKRVQTFVIAAFLHLAPMSEINREFYWKHHDRFDRLLGFMQVLIQHGETLKRWTTHADMPADALAERMWQAGWFDALAGKTRDWLERQLPHEVINLWPALDSEEAKALFPVEYEIVQAAWLSPYVAPALEGVAEQ